MSISRAVPQTHMASRLVEHLDAGLWYLYLYNDETKPQYMGFSAEESGMYVILDKTFLV